MIKHFVVVRVDRATRLKSKVQIYFIPVLVIRLLTPSGILTNNDFIECVKVTKSLSSLCTYSGQFLQSRQLFVSSSVNLIVS